MPSWKRITGTCRYCGASIDKMSRARQRGYYCNHQCYYDHKHQRSISRQPIRQQLLIIKRCIRKISKTLKKMERPGISPVRFNNCYSCNAPFRITQAYQRTCSPSCAHLYAAAKHATKKKNTRIHNVIAKQGLTIADAQRIDPIDILERDGWRCQICGKQLDKALRGTTSNDAPEMDHIVPIGKGGTHTIDNVQCACRSCNIEKGESLHYIKMRTV